MSCGRFGPPPGVMVDPIPAGPSLGPCGIFLSKNEFVRFFDGVNLKSVTYVLKRV